MCVALAGRVLSFLLVACASVAVWRAWSVVARVRCGARRCVGAVTLFVVSEFRVGDAWNRTSIVWCDSLFPGLTGPVMVCYAIGVR